MMEELLPETLLKRINESWKCIECGGIRDGVPKVLIPEDTWFTVGIDELGIPNHQLFPAGRYCSLCCFAKVWDRLYPLWLERDRSKDE